MNIYSDLQFDSISHYLNFNARLNFFNQSISINLFSSSCYHLINLNDFDQVQINSNNCFCFDDASPYSHVCNFNLIAIKYVINQYFIDILRTFT